MPQRIQLKRQKGYRKPPECVVVARPGPFGNPFSVANYTDAHPQATAAEAARGCVELFREWLAGNLSVVEERRLEMLRRLPELRGKDLACWCGVGAPCHADVLMELASRDPT